MTESQRTPRGRNWVKEDVERLVHWMEENQQSLRGKQSVWHNDIKEQVFAEDEDITVKRIREKVQNMKNAWRSARKLWQQSGSGLRAEDNPPTLNALLESKCPLFWKLEGIWGGHPSTTPVLITDSTRTQGQTQEPDPLSGEKPEGTDTSTLARGFRHDSEDEDVEREETPPRELSPIVPSVTGSPKGSQRQTRRRGKAGEVLQGIMRDRGVIELQKEEKRLELERELHKEKMKAEDRRLERQLESQERIARIQADGQVRQFQVFMDMMSMVTGSQRLGSPSGTTQLTSPQQPSASSDGASSHCQT